MRKIDSILLVRVSRAVGIVVAIVTLISIPVQGSAVPSAGPTHSQVRFLRVPTGQALEAPAIYGRTIFWAGRTKHDKTSEVMYSSPIARLKSKRLFVSRPEPDVTYIRVSAHWLTWVGYGAGRGWVIYAKNRQNEEALRSG